jgi:hypothetical protein
MMYAGLSGFFSALSPACICFLNLFSMNGISARLNNAVRGAKTQVEPNAGID